MLTHYFNIIIPTLKYKTSLIGTLVAPVQTISMQYANSYRKIRFMHIFRRTCFKIRLFKIRKYIFEKSGDWSKGKYAHACLIPTFSM